MKLEFKRKFVETRSFAKDCKKLLGKKLTDELYEYLDEHPESGDLIPEGAGLRKLRWARPGMGKRGGARVVYHYVSRDGFILMLAVYAKSEQEDISKATLRELAKQSETIIERLRKDFNNA